MRPTLAIVCAALALAPSVGVARPGEERWSAGSHTAMGITGDITLSPTALVVAGKTFPLVVAADVKGFQTDQGPQSVRILRVTRPMNPVLLNTNRFCTTPVGWIVVYRSDGRRNLNMDVFAAGARPTKEDVPSLCGTFLFVR